MPRKAPRLKPDSSPPVRRSRKSRSEAAPTLKRKNLAADQRRLDLLKALLGAKTEAEAITMAMDFTLEMAAFESEVRAGAKKMLGKGGFVNWFDDEALSDCSGFISDPLPATRED